MRRRTLLAGGAMGAVLNANPQRARAHGSRPSSFLNDARAKIEAWRRDFDESRPHTSLGFMTPAEFASSAGVNPGR
ncbi:MAG: transposase [Phenylobacterium sp.]|nr:transposase [Phenylobacterium sp.]MCA6231940.1 transposase [Phenylobacterium sp.]MCA6249261.1 transposase [Phenylobacterium sp.]MCA6251216.1 transposase [Phenylobacterium sp.]MCA6257221.1 transposase [Phenylobacterium sp.]